MACVLPASANLTVAFLRPSFLNAFHRKSNMTALKQQNWGKMPDGTEVKLFTLSNDNGIVAKITNYGAIVTELHTPDRDGQPGDVVLGFDNLEQYLKGHPFFGAIA